MQKEQFREISNREFGNIYAKHGVSTEKQGANDAIHKSESYRPKKASPGQDHEVT